jgi:hypothetical protein
MVVVSIIGCDRFAAGYNAAKVAHERAMLSGSIPVRILRAAQFHEFVEQLVEWGRQGEVSYVPKMRTQTGRRQDSRRGAGRPGHRPRIGARTAVVWGIDPGDRRSAGGQPCRHGETARGPAR